jgi:hypothetical protein
MSGSDRIIASGRQAGFACVWHADFACAWQTGFAAAALLLLAGCAGGMPALGGATTAYSASNAILPIGYSETTIDATHYEVKASGSEQTSRERIEKIALARAAEIGVEQRLPYFKVAAVTHGAACSKKTRGGPKVGDSPATSHPTVVLDVYYSKTPLPDHRSSADTFAQVKAELDADVSPPEAQAAAAAQIRAECGAS